MPSRSGRQLRLAFRCGAALLATPAIAQQTFAPEQQQAMIAGICLGQLPIGEEGCACLAQRAMTGLDDAQRDYLLLTVIDPVRAQTSPVAGSQTDLTAIFSFLQEAGEECASGAAPPPASGGSDGAGEAGQN